MKPIKVTKNVWCTQCDERHKPVLVVRSEATEIEVEFCKAVEAFGIWTVVWEKVYKDFLKKVGAGR